MSDLKEQITQLLCCLFEKIIAKLQEQLCSVLMKGLGLGGGNNGGNGNGGNLGDFIEKLDTRTVTPEDRVPQVPMCYVETLTGDVISANKKEITGAVDNIIDKVGGFLEGITKQLDAVQSGLSAASGAVPSIDGISGNMASALSFENLELSVFGCDFKPKASVSDFYTFASGSGGTAAAASPNINEVAEKAASTDVQVAETPTKPYAVPQRDASDVDLDPGAPGEDVSGALDIA